MNKDDVVEAFDQACIGLAAFMDDHMDQEFPEGELTVTIPFMNTQMSDIDDIWWDDENIIAARNYYDSLSGQARLGLTKMAVSMIEQNPNHKKQLEMVLERSGARDSMSLMPHILTYASDLYITDGFETLNTVCDTMDDIALSPFLVTNPHTENLNSAFMLAVCMQSVDGEPLRDKIKRATDAGLFQSVRVHYGLN